MKNRAIQIHPADNVRVALDGLQAGDRIDLGEASVVLRDDVRPKHKFATEAIATGGPVRMYGLLVGTAAREIAAGERLTTDNIRHAAAPFERRTSDFKWQPPEVDRFAERQFQGLRRSDGRVGTANYWLIIPLVFCENRNVHALRSAFDEALGYATKSRYRTKVEQLLASYRKDGRMQESTGTDAAAPQGIPAEARPFPRVDGIRYLTHPGGCGEQRSDSEALARLLAGYVTHPNAAGATVLSLGCQNTQAEMLKEAVAEIAPGHDRPLYILQQQKAGSEKRLLSRAVELTFSGLIGANRCRREPVPISRLVMGVECGGSDGFSGISANPAIGHAADLLVAAGGSVILSEFPELCGVEQDLIDRSVNDAVAQRFIDLQRTYAERVAAQGSGFDMNPSPGNIRDGLLTDAMKSAGAAKKGGTAPVVDVLDYTEPLRKRGLNLLCTPGGDVESTTAMTGSGATVIAFSTGLGTPTGNAVAPVIKIASNTDLAMRMPDIIDIDAGTVITGDASIEEVGTRLLDLVVSVASGETVPAAVRLRQDDFIPWKRGLSL